MEGLLEQYTRGHLSRTWGSAKRPLSGSLSLGKEGKHPNSRVPLRWPSATRTYRARRGTVQIRLSVCLASCTLCGDCGQLNMLVLGAVL